MSEQVQQPEFSKPTRQILLMVACLGLVGLLAYWLYKPVEEVFWANPYLNGMIVFVFVIGLGATFLQVGRLVGAVGWIDGFVEERPGHEFVSPPRLLASMSALLRDRRARKALTATSTRSILDTVASRLDESRDITRYIINLLIFLGLLGTFWGLANTVPAVVQTIRALAPHEGETGVAVFGRLMTGLEGQLGGMGTAFASSLLGLAGSLVVGLLELLTGHAQNRFYRELEEWLSSITRLHTGGDGEGPGSAYLSALLEQNAEQMNATNKLLAKVEERRSSSENAVTGIAARMEAMSARLVGDREVLTRIADSQERMIDHLATIARAERQPREPHSDFDEESRQHIRNIDIQLLRVLEEIAAGRQDAVAELRAEIKLLSRTIGAAADRSRGE